MNLNGIEVWPGYLSPAEQHALVVQLRDVVRRAPMVSPQTRRGPMSVRMSAAGRFGWTTGPEGGCYIARHPNGTDWPPIPDGVRAIWDALLPQARAPECCLINFYGPEARMGLHQDRDEADLSQPVLSVSLGDSGLLRVGGTARGGPTQSLWLNSGDVLVMGGAARLAYHGIDRIKPQSSRLLPRGGRLNLTLRVVT